MRGGACSVADRPRDGHTDERVCKYSTQNCRPCNQCIALAPFRCGRVACVGDTAGGPTCAAGGALASCAVCAIRSSEIWPPRCTARGHVCTLRELEECIRLKNADQRLRLREAERNACGRHAAVHNCVEAAMATCFDAARVEAAASCTGAWRAYGSQESREIKTRNDMQNVVGAVKAVAGLALRGNGDSSTHRVAQPATYWRSQCQIETRHHQCVGGFPHVVLAEHAQRNEHGVRLCGRRANVERSNVDGVHQLANVDGCGRVRQRARDVAACGVIGHQNRKLVVIRHEWHDEIHHVRLNRSMLPCGGCLSTSPPIRFATKKEGKVHRGILRVAIDSAQVYKATKLSTLCSSRVAARRGSAECSSGTWITERTVLYFCNRPDNDRYSKLSRSERAARRHRDRHALVTHETRSTASSQDTHMAHAVRRTVPPHTFPRSLPSCRRVCS